jgi:predicted GTPase
MKKQRLIIMGAAGRDFHNFNMACRDNADFEVVAFTANPVPISAEGFILRKLAGSLYPEASP